MAKQDTVATLLRELVLQEAPMTAQRSLRLRQRPGHSLADILPVTSTSTAGRSVHTVTRLDDFVAQALNHTDHLPPVLCTREDMRGYYPDATQSEMGAFRAHVFGPVRLAAAVLGHLGHVRVSQAMLNASDEDGTGHLLYCDAADKADSEARMIVLGLPPRHFTSDDLRAFSAQNEVPALAQKAAPSTRVWHHVADLCQRNNVRYFAISTYDEWILGCFTDGYASASISPAIPYTGTRPTVVECLCYWIERARRDGDGVVSTGSITAPKQPRVRFAPDDRDEPENMPPRTPRKRRAVDTSDDHSPVRRRAEESSSPRKRRVAEDSGLPVGSPEKKQRREREREREALIQLNADVEMSSARAADIFAAAAPATRGLSPVKMLLNEEELRGPVDVQEGVLGHRRYQRSAAAARMAFRGL
ncbi:hypothetical protein EXIGLDRAFT_833465 [Exidia glandulosa HHB12029]|uniref:Uncharacterized protein n=1 Tax=Exidia glandulosa HHB12029 TaxID=1314781 RepID=A0A165KNL4_EXIGL|nr:hypothetical protein EXIGLDRAFT_833465 [Exidia glandulosa HHB12029]